MLAKLKKKIKIVLEKYYKSNKSYACKLLRSQPFKFLFLRLFFCYHFTVNIAKQLLHEMKKQYFFNFVSPCFLNTEYFAKYALSHFSLLAKIKSLGQKYFFNLDNMEPELPYEDDLLQKAEDKVDLGEVLIKILDEFSEIPGVQKVQRKIVQEIKFLKKVRFPY